MNGVRMPSLFSPLLNLETLASIHTQSGSIFLTIRICLAALKDSVFRKIGLLVPHV